MCERSLTDLQNYAKEHNGICLSTVYTGLRDIYEWQCSLGHKFPAIGNIINLGTWCKECDRIKQFGYTIDDLHKKAESRGGKCHSTEYKGNDFKYSWECKNGHKWDAMWRDIKKGRWCNQCVKNKKKDIQWLYDKAKELGGKCTSQVYINAHTKYDFICGEGHTFQKTGAELAKDSWCVECSLKNRPFKYTIKDLQNTAQSRNGKCHSLVYSGILDLYEWECEKGHRWFQNYDNILRGHWCGSCQSHTSSAEVEIIEYIKSIYSGIVISGDRKQIYPKELDIYIPEKNLAIEYNGLYWHSEHGNPDVKRCHLEKIKAIQDKGINFLSIFEDEWKDNKKQELIKKMISYRLTNNLKKIRANKLELVKIENKADSYKFFDENHINGHVVASLTYGLYENDELLSCMSFRHNAKDKCWEIARFATKQGYKIYGNAGKLLNAFKKDNPNLRLITYSDNRIGNGNVYKEIGFKEISNSDQLDYYYTDDKKRLTRYQCQKIHDPEILKDFPTEKDQVAGGVFSRKYLGHSRPLYKIYGYGNKKWELFT